MGGQIDKITKYLNEHIRGSAYSADRILDAYSTDRSIIKIRPKAVVLPTSVDDVRQILRLSDQLALRKVVVPVTIRGSGRGKTGASLSPGIVISMEQMNKISEIDVRQRLVRCEAGVTLGQLNSALALHGLIIPVIADPARTIGSLIADSTRLDLSQKPPAPHIYNHLEKAEIVLSSGDLLQTEVITSKTIAAAKGQRDRENAVYRKLAALVTSRESTIKTLLDPATLSPLGYASIARLIDTPLSITPLLFGSQGSLAVITETILRCEFLADAPTYFFAEFKNIDAALDFATTAAALHPATLDVYDLSLLSEVHSLGKSLRPFATDALVSGFLVATSFSDVKRRKRRAKIHKLTTLTTSVASSFSTRESAPDFAELHSILLTYLNSSSRITRPPIVDGAYVPPDRLDAYLIGLKTLEEKYDTSLPFFGSHLSHTYSVRPEIDLGTVPGRQFALSFLREYHELIHTLGGTLAGDSAEGRTLAIATAPSLDPKLTKLYAELKEIFDPHAVLNPGIKHEVSLRSTIHNLRTSYDPGLNTP